MTFKKIKSYIVNPIDICIIIMILAIIVSGFVVLNNKKLFLIFNPTENAVISLSVPVDGDVTEHSFEVGQKVYLASSNDPIGVISNVTNVKEKIYSAINNTLLYDYSDKNIAIIIDVETQVKVHDNKKYINNSLFVSGGASIDVVFEDAGKLNAFVEEIIVK